MPQFPRSTILVLRGDKGVPEMCMKCEMLLKWREHGVPWCHGSWNQGHISSNTAGRSSLLQRCPEGGMPLTSQYPAGHSIMRSRAQGPPEQGRKGGGQSGEGGDGAIPYVIIPSTHNFSPNIRFNCNVFSSISPVQSLCPLPQTQQNLTVL